MSQSVFASVKKYVLGALFAILVGMLLIGLSMFGVTDAFMSRSKDAAAIIGKEKINLSDFSSQFSKRLSEYNKTATERLTNKQAYERGLHRQVLDQMIVQKLVQIDADNLGLAANERDVIKAVEDLKVFNNEITGKFDKKKMLEQLYRLDNTMTPKKLEQQIKESLRHEQIVSSIINGLVSPQEFVDQQYRFMTEQRKAKLLIISKNAITPPADPGDEVLKKYIKQNQARFIAPEYRRFTLLRMEQDDVFVDMKASDEEIKERFEYKIEVGQLGRAETRSYMQIVAKDEAQANEITDAINAGQKIDEIIKTYGLDTPLVYENTNADASTDPKTGQAAFEIDKINTAKTIPSSFGGWYSVVLTRINPKIVPNLEDEREKISAEIKTDKAKQFIYDASDKIQKNLEQGMSLEEAGEAAGVSVASYDFISRLGETQEGAKMKGFDYAPGVAEDDIILKEIFTADIGFDGDVFETQNEGIAAVRVNEIKDSAPKKFEKIRNQALKAWQFEQINNQLAELSAEALKKAQNGERLEDIAQDINKKIKTNATDKTGAKVEEIMMMRAIATPNISQQLAISLFEAKKGKYVRGMAANGLDRVIGKIIEITPNNDAVIGDIADKMAEAAKQQISSDIQEAYRVESLKNHPVTIMESNIKRILGIEE